jgi:lipoate-protein ligase B
MTAGSHLTNFEISPRPVNTETGGVVLMNPKKKISLDCPFKQKINNNFTPHGVASNIVFPAFS